MNSKLILLGLILAFNAVFSQIKQTYNTVKLTLNNGKEISGYIIPPKLGNKTTVLNFKTQLENEESKTLNINTIKSFIVDSKQEYSVITINNRSLKDTFISKVMIKGKASLYQTYIDNNISYIVSYDDKTCLLREDELKLGATELTKYNYFGKLNYTLDGFIKNNSNANFSKSYFKKIILKFNESIGSKSISTKVIKNKKAFIMLTAIGNFWEESKSEYNLQLIYRKYLTDFSDKTSINVGFTYNRYNVTEVLSLDFSKNEEIEKSWSNLYNIPLFIQHDFLKFQKMRANIYSGIQLSYIDLGGYAERKEKEYRQYKNRFYKKNNLQKTYGFSFMYGVGLEFDMTNNIMINAAYKSSLYDHLPMVGLTYYIE